MYLYKRGKYWWYEVLKDGVRHRSSTGCTRKDKAKEFAEHMGVVRRAGCREKALALVDVFFPPEKKPGLPISSAWESYTTVAKATGRLEIAPKSISARRNIFENFEDWLEKFCPAVEHAEEVTGPIAARYASYLATLKSQKSKKKPLSSKRRQNIIAELGTVWRTLEKISADIRNPWSGLTPTDTDGKRGEAFSREQERAIMAAAEKVGKGWPVACLVARHTGLRYGDIATLKWSEVDFVRNVIALEPRKTRRHGIAVTVPMVAPLRAALARERENSQPGIEYVLPFHAQLYGNNSESAYKALNFKEVLDSADVAGDGYTFHSWRHTMRSRLAEAGTDIETAKRLLGHTSDAMSLHYDHADHIEEMRTAVEAAASQ